MRSCMQRYVNIVHCIINSFLPLVGAMLATQLNELVNNGELEVKAIIRLDKYICNTIQETR